MLTRFVAIVALVLTGCPGSGPGNGGGTNTGPRPDPRRAGPDARAPGGACPSPVSPPLSVPPNVRRAVRLEGGYQVLVGGLRASELPPCTGRCPAPKMTITLLDARGHVCWNATLPDEHRVGPAAAPGGAVVVGGNAWIFALSWKGKLISKAKVPEPRVEPVGLSNGGVAIFDGAGELHAFKRDGSRRFRRRPTAAGAPLALATGPGGGMSGAYGNEARAWDADGVRRFKTTLPDTASQRGVAFVAGGYWVWSRRGAYRLGAGGKLLTRLPAKAPADGQVFAAVGARDRLYAIISEKGFHPITLVAAEPSGAPEWTRPYTGDRPKDCAMQVSPPGQVSVRCGEGRIVVRDEKGITRFDEVGRSAGLVALGPRGRFAVAFDSYLRDMTRVCWVRRWGARGEGHEWSIKTKGRCARALWFDGGGGLNLGSQRIAR